MLLSLFWKYPNVSASDGPVQGAADGAGGTVAGLVVLVTHSFLEPIGRLVSLRDSEAAPGLVTG